MNRHDYSKKQISYDSKTLIELMMIMHNHPVPSIGINPYLSLMCVEILNYCDKYDIKFELPQNNKLNIENIRIKLKLFEDKYSKSKRIVYNCDYLQDYIFRKKLRFRFTQNLNIHYNLGIYFDDKNNVIGNTQYAYYIFQDNKFLKNKIEEVRKMGSMNKFETPIDIVSDDMFQLGKFQGELLFVIASHFNHYTSHIPLNIDGFKEHSIPIYFKDYNTNKHFKYIYKDNDEKILYLYLLHTLSFINFTIKVLSKFDSKDTGWWLRVYYIVYHYSISKLKNLKSHLQNYTYNNLDISKYINDLLDSDIDEFLNSKFRSYMMHYDFFDKNGIFLIDGSYLNNEKILFGLVETCYGGQDYFKIKTQIYKKLETISDALCEILNVSTNSVEQL